ncbi:hypothetical protein ABEV34_27625 [Methylorubrum rhodesianum]|uniref:hypothetical protein n=1 Tax=Methylorubrum TaxID=2282523 RepID=UPI0016195C3D|nr:MULTISPECIES: hypothetical protein [Methylorubrum]MBB5761420.1 hypothetical protein [Methylorubrum rhodesianum]
MDEPSKDEPGKDEPGEPGDRGALPLEPPAVTGDPDGGDGASVSVRAQDVCRDRRASRWKILMENPGCPVALRAA